MDDVTDPGLPTTAPVPLPMALGDCGLDAAALAAQLERYERLGRCLARVERHERELTAWFTQALDAALVQQTIEVERGCCGFFTLAFDPADRRLSISVAEAERVASLDAIHAALAGRRRGGVAGIPPRPGPGPGLGAGPGPGQT